MTAESGRRRAGRRPARARAPSSVAAGATGDDRCPARAGARTAPRPRLRGAVYPEVVRAAEAERRSAGARPPTLAGALAAVVGGASGPWSSHDRVRERHRAVGIGVHAWLRVVSRRAVREDDPLQVRLYSASDSASRSGSRPTRATSSRPSTERFRAEAADEGRTSTRESVRAFSRGRSASPASGERGPVGRAASRRREARGRRERRAEEPRRREPSRSRRLRCRGPGRYARACASRSRSRSRSGCAGCSPESVPAAARAATERASRAR